MEGITQSRLKKCISEAGREVSLRRWVYPGLIEKGKLTRKQSAEQIQLMKDIQEALRELERLKFPPPPTLFDS